MGFWSALAGLAKGILVGSFISKAVKVLSRGITRVANAVANFLERMNYHTAARTVRHIARYTVKIGQAIIKSVQRFGTVLDIADVVTNVDELSIQGENGVAVGLE